VHTYAYDPPDGGPRFNGRLQAHAMRIEDARAAGSAGSTCSLATTGFQLCTHRSAVHDFWDEAELQARAYPEAEALVRELTGATLARAFDHTLRRRAVGRPPLDGSGGSFAAVREPVGRVHLDYTPTSAPMRVAQVLGDAERAARVVAGGYLIVGLWRPTLEEPLRDAPLALADRRSVQAQDLVPNDLIYRERRGQTFAIRHNPAHSWHYFRGQRRDEVAVFLHYDGRRADDAGGNPHGLGATPHTGFEDPTTPAHATPRQSLEMRVLAWFER
jgi:hypothetical protein